MWGMGEGERIIMSIIHVASDKRDYQVNIFLILYKNTC